MTRGQTYEVTYRIRSITPMDERKSGENIVNNGNLCDGTSWNEEDHFVFVSLALTETMEERIKL